MVKEFPENNRCGCESHKLQYVYKDQDQCQNRLTISFIMTWGFLSIRRGFEFWLSPRETHEDIHNIYLGESGKKCA